jgi:hypothetical protein
MNVLVAITLDNGSATGRGTVDSGIRIADPQSPRQQAKRRQNLLKDRIKIGGARYDPRQAIALDQRDRGHRESGSDIPSRD